MQNRASVLLATTLFIASAGFAKDKKPPLPFTVLQAKTVAVLVDPDAGISIEDPRANQVAQKDVETAFLNWGRFLPLLSGQPADLIIVVRRGHGHLVDDTITDSLRCGFVADVGDDRVKSNIWRDPLGSKCHKHGVICFQPIGAAECTVANERLE